MSFKRQPGGSYGTQISPYVIIGVESIPPGLVITLDGKPAVGPGGLLVTPSAVPVAWGPGHRVGVTGSSPSPWEASTPSFNLFPPDTSPSSTFQPTPGTLTDQEALQHWPVPPELRGALSNRGYISEVRKGGGAGKWLTIVFQGPVGSGAGAGGAPGAITRPDGVGALVLLGVVVVAGVVLKYLFGRRR